MPMKCMFKDSESRKKNYFFTDIIFTLEVAHDTDIVYIKMKNNNLNLLLEEFIARDFTLNEAWEIINELKLLKNRKEQLKKNYNISYLKAQEETWFKNRLKNCHKIFNAYKIIYQPEELIKD